MARRFAGFVAIGAIAASFAFGCSSTAVTQGVPQDTIEAADMHAPPSDLAADDGPAADEGPPPDPALPFEQASYGVGQLYTLQYAPFRQQQSFAGDDYRTWTDGHVAALGVHWTRLRNLLTWSQVQPALAGPYRFADPAGPDEVLAAVYRAPADFAVQAVVVIDPSRYGLEGAVYPDGLEEDFAAFVQTVVKRYNGDGRDDVDSAVRVRYWQCLDDAAGAIAAGRLTPQRYGELVLQFAAAVRQVDPHARVVLGYLGGHLPAVVAQLSGQSAFDAVDLQVIDVSDAQSSPGVSTAVDIRALLDRSGYGAAALWSLQLGTYAGRPRSDLSSHSVALQAEWLVRNFVTSRAQGVERLLWPTLIDWSNYGGDPQSPLNAMGLIDDGAGPDEPAALPGTLRPAYAALAALVATTDALHADFQGPAEGVEAPAFGYVFADRHSGLRRLIAWSQDPEAAPVWLPVGDTAQARLTSFVLDATGQPARSETLDVTAGKAHVRLDLSPVRIEPLFASGG